MLPSDADPIYLDYNATTPVAGEVLEAMIPYLEEHFGNPSSSHVYGRRARKAVDRARHQVASLIGAADDEIFFTSGGTESNNLAILGTATALDRPGRVVTSTIEHSAVSRPCEQLSHSGFDVERVGVGAEGRLDIDAFGHTVNDDISLVTIMHSNNETGVIQPVAACAQLAKARGALVHTDAAQSVAKVEIDVDELGVDLLSIAGHKLYAPKGVGALYVRDGTPLEPVLFGASHERGLRPGTENVASVVGLGKACEMAAQTLMEESRRIAELRDRMWTRLREAIPHIALNGHPTERLPNTLNIRFPEVVGEQLLAVTPTIAASAGSACHEGGRAASTVIRAMGVGAEQALGSIRLSLGRSTSPDDIERAATALISAWKNLG